MHSRHHHVRRRQSNHLEPVNPLSQPKRRQPSVGGFIFGLCLVFVVSSIVGAAQTQNPTQNPLPFEVSNPQNKKWPPAEARRIYSSACQLLARTIRPDKPPELHPQFRLVLGTENDEFVRNGSRVEVHLRSWQPEIFAQAVVAIAVRDLLQADQLQKVAHQSVMLANATVDAHDLR